MKSVTKKHTAKIFKKNDPVKNFGNKKTTFISGKHLHKNTIEDSARKILEAKAVLCRQQVRTTGTPRKGLSWQLVILK